MLFFVCFSRRAPPFAMKSLHLGARAAVNLGPATLWGRVQLCAPRKVAAVGFIRLLGHQGLNWVSVMYQTGR